MNRTQFILAILTIFAWQNSAIAQQISKKAERAMLDSLIKVAKLEAKTTDSVWPISQLIDTFSFQHPENKTYVREHKIEFIERRYKYAIKRLPESERIEQPEVQEVLTEYDSIIAQCTNCSRIYAYASAIESLDEFGIKTSKKTPKFKQIIDSGYKFPKEGMGLGISAMYGNDAWIGGQWSAFRSIQPRYQIKERDKKTGEILYSCTSKTFLTASISTLGYARNLDASVNDFSMSLMHLTAPLLINITQFGFQKGGYIPDRAAWYYRPEIGFGYGGFSLGASYTAMFSASARSYAEKWMLVANFNHPIN